MDTTPTRTLADLKAAAKNPRKVTKAKLKQLERTMDQFGDLGGIVFDVRSESLISGHQRLAAMKQAGGEVKVVVTHRYDQTTEDKEHGNQSEHGTVADGYVEHAGARFAYREVDWPQQRADLARIAANKQAGSFDATVLASTLQELGNAGADLNLSMFDPDELRAYLPDVGKLMPDVKRETLSGPDADEGMEDEGEYEEDEPQPERLHGATPAQDAPQAQPPEEPGIKSVALYYRLEDHKKFVEIVDALKDVFHKTNTSDVVLEALKRHAVTAAFK